MDKKKGRTVIKMVGNIKNQIKDFQVGDEVCRVGSDIIRYIISIEEDTWGQIVAWQISTKGNEFFKDTLEWLHKTGNHISKEELKKFIIKTREIKN